MQIAPIIIAIVFISSIAYADCDLPVTAVRDGDTFTAITKTEVSPSVTLVERTGFRLARVNTPEKKERGWAKAKAYLEKRILGKMVEIQFGNRIREKYGRFLVELFVCEDGAKVNVNDEIIKRGF